MSEYPRLVKLLPNYSIKPFHCDNDDLDEFLSKDAIAYTTQLLAMTYLYKEEACTKAYFSVLNDSIRLDTDDAKLKKWFKKNILRHLPHEKRGYPSYPAVKVGRFAVHRDFQKTGVGTELLGYIKGFFLSKNKTGCRFITVDAYRDSVDFYRKNDFDFLTEKDRDDDTRLMYFDLKTIDRAFSP